MEDLLTPIDWIKEYYPLVYDILEIGELPKDKVIPIVTNLMIKYARYAVSKISQ